MVRAASTWHIDVVLVDREEIDPEIMLDAGFSPVPASRHAWEYESDGRAVRLEIAAVASSKQAAGPFSVALRHAERRTIAGAGRATSPTCSTRSKRSRSARAGDLSVPAIRLRLRDAYGKRGPELKDLVALYRAVPRPGSE